MVSKTVILLTRLLSSPILYPLKSPEKTPEDVFSEDLK